MAEIVAEEIAKITNVLRTVPMKPGIDPKSYFLDIYKLTYNDINELNLTEERWDLLYPIPVNKLLKLGISFGNLVKSFLMEQAAYDSKHQLDANNRKHQSSDPFLDNYKSGRLPVSNHYISFARNFHLLLKNFDVGSPLEDSKRSRNSRSSLGLAESETHSTHGSQTSGGVTGSPIKLNSRQLLIEKLEINISLDPLFTMKIVLKLLVSMFNIVRALVDSLAAEEISELAAIRAYSESSSIFSNNSATSGGQDSITTMDDYLRFIQEIIARVNLGIVDPLNNMLLTEIVEPRAITSFQNLTNSI